MTKTLDQTLADLQFAVLANRTKDHSALHVQTAAIIKQIARYLKKVDERLEKLEGKTSHIPVGALAAAVKISPEEATELRKSSQELAAKLFTEQKPAMYHLGPEDAQSLTGSAMASKTIELPDDAWNALFQSIGECAGELPNGGHVKWNNPDKQSNNGRLTFGSVIFIRAKKAGS